MIKFACPSCGKRLGVEDRLAGRRGACPKCRRSFVVPSQAAPPPPRMPQQEDTDYGVNMGEGGERVAFTCRKCGAPNDAIAVGGVAKCEFCDAANPIAVKAPPAPDPPIPVAEYAGPSPVGAVQPVVVNIVNNPGAPAAPSHQRPVPREDVDKTGLGMHLIVGAVLGVLVAAGLSQTCLPIQAALIVGILIFLSSFMSKRWSCPECRTTYILRYLDTKSRFRCANKSCGMMFCSDCKERLGESCPRCGNSVRVVTGMN